MAQKLGLLATLLTERPLLILDEPMSGLDPKARLGLKQELAAARARGQTILMSSHELADQDQLCDRVALLHQGRLGYVGAPGELKRRTQAAHPRDRLPGRDRGRADARRRRRYQAQKVSTFALGLRACVGGAAGAPAKAKSWRDRYESVGPRSAALAAAHQPVEIALGLLQAAGRVAR